MMLERPSRQKRVERTTHGAFETEIFVLRSRILCTRKTPFQGDRERVEGLAILFLEELQLAIQINWHWSKYVYNKIREVGWGGGGVKR